MDENLCRMSTSPAFAPLAPGFENAFLRARGCSGFFPKFEKKRFSQACLLSDRLNSEPYSREILKVTLHKK